MKPKFEKGRTTSGELYTPAMKITNQQEADEWFEALVEYSMSWGQTREEAEQLQRSNLGYWTGYWDSETAARVQRLFQCAHPIFGTTRPTPEEALEAGKALASESSV